MSLISENTNGAKDYAFKTTKVKAKARTKILTFKANVRVKDLTFKAKYCDFVLKKNQGPKPRPRTTSLDLNYSLLHIDSEGTICRIKIPALILIPS